MQTERTDAQWRAHLGADAFHILRERGTESAGSGEYNLLKVTSGHFACRGCSRPLYSAMAKFESGCGWPAFSRCYQGAVVLRADLEHFNAYGCRVEIICASCDGHLGHVFRELGKTHLGSTDERHCVNSLSVRYMPSEPGEELAEAVVGTEYDKVLAGALKQLMGL